MEDFAERLGRLSELSDEELSSLEDEIVTAFDAADEAQDLPTMEGLADAIDQVRAEIETRGDTEEPEAEAESMPEEMAASAAETEEVEEVVAAVEGEDEAPEAEAEPEAEIEADIVVEASAETETEEGAEEAPAEDAVEEEVTAAVEAEVEAEVSDEAVTEIVEPVAADASDEAEAEATDPVVEEDIVVEPEAEEAQDESEDTVATEITAADVPEENVPVAASAPVVIRAGGDVPGFTAGAELSSMDSVYEAMSAKVRAMSGLSRGDGERVIVASLRYGTDAPEDKTLRPGDQEGNSRKIREMLSDKEALTAGGMVAAGWCAPRAPQYDVPTVGTTDRPVRNALPTFNADRGGITWMRPPALPDNAGALSLWRHNGSAWVSYTNPAGTTQASPNDQKPCFTVTCGSEQSIDVDALPLCICFDNLTARAFPEWIRANTDLTMVAQARFAEQKSLAQMFAVVATGGHGAVTASLGVARDFISTVRESAASFRWYHRMQGAPLQLLAPSWLAEAIAIDLGLQAPGDDKFGTVSTSDVDGYLGEFGVQAIWYIDDAPSTAAFTGAAFPATANWLLFPTGAFVRLDTGELNLGVVRTKEDLQKNAYCEFSETFEAVAYMGPDPATSKSWVVRGLTTVNLLGSHSLGTDLAASFT